MAAYQSLDISVPTSTTGGPEEDGIGAAVAVHNLCDKWLVVTGFSTDEVDFQISLDEGATYVTPTDLDGLAADTAVPIEIPFAATHIRAVCVSGTPDMVATVRGMQLSHTPPLI
jgi:hypothetical protein